MTEPVTKDVGEWLLQPDAGKLEPALRGVSGPREILTTRARAPGRA
jgi:hypothetical protein